MSLSDSFPIYSYHLVTPKGSKIKISTRKVYVDVAPDVYFFIFDTINKFNRGKKINVKILWNRKSQKNNNLNLEGKNIYTIFLNKNSITGKTQISYRVNWKLLQAKLEKESEDIVKELKTNGKVRLEILYDRLASNYFKIRNSTASYSTINLRRLKIKMQHNKDFDELIQHGENIKKISTLIEQKYPTDSFYELSNRLSEYINNLDFNGIYYTLREFSERLLPILFLNAIVKTDNLDKRIAISFYMVYLNYSIDKVWRNKGKISNNYINSSKDFIKISNNFLGEIKTNRLVKDDGGLDWENINSALKNNKINLPIIRADANAFKITLNKLGVKCSDNFKHIYEICSSSIHNILSLPYPSILELKVAKNFLKWYLDCLEAILKETYIIPPMGIKKESIIDKKIRANPSKLIEFLENNKTAIKDLIKCEINNDIIGIYKLISSTLLIYGVSVTKLKKNCDNYDNFKQFLSYINEIHYNSGLDLINYILKQLGIKIENQFNNIDKAPLDKYTVEEISYVALILYFIYWNN